MGKRNSEASWEDSKKKTLKCNKTEQEAISQSLLAINGKVLIDEAISELKSRFSE